MRIAHNLYVQALVGQSIRNPELYTAFHYPQGSSSRRSSLNHSLLHRPRPSRENTMRTFLLKKVQFSLFQSSCPLTPKTSRPAAELIGQELCEKNLICCHSPVHCSCRVCCHSRADPGRYQVRVRACAIRRWDVRGTHPHRRAPHT